MRNMYGPYDKEQKSGLEQNDDFYSKYRTAGAGRLGANLVKNSGKKAGSITRSVSSLSLHTHTQ